MRLKINFSKAEGERATKETILQEDDHCKRNSTQKNLTMSFRSETKNKQNWLKIDFFTYSSKIRRRKEVGRID